MKFYDIFRFGGTIGVNELTFGDVIMGKLLAIVIMIGILGSLAFLFPIFMLIVYLLLLVGDNWEGTQLDRVRVSILGLIGGIYFMFDYHFGLIGWAIFNTIFGSELVDKLCYINTTILILNIFFLSYGNKLLNNLDSSLERLIIFGAILFFSYKVLIPISSGVIPYIITQNIKEVVQESGENIEESSNNKDLYTLDEQIEDFENGR
jgi:hypothetical protein